MGAGVARTHQDGVRQRGRTGLLNENPAEEKQ